MMVGGMRLAFEGIASRVPCRLLACQGVSRRAAFPSAVSRVEQGRWKVASKGLVKATRRIRRIRRIKGRGELCELCEYCEGGLHTGLTRPAPCFASSRFF